MRVIKFGGSSLATPDRIRKVARIILDEARQERLIVVVSAFERVTNQLLEAARLAERGDGAYEEAYARLAKRHRIAIDELIGTRGATPIRARVDALLAELHEALHGIHLLRHCPPLGLDLVG